MPALFKNTSPFPWQAAAPSLVLSVVLLAVSICAAVALYLTQRDSAAALDRAATAFDAAVTLELNAREVRSHLTRYVETGDETLLSNLTDLPDTTDQGLTHVENVAISTAGRAKIAAYRRSLSELNRQLRELTAVERDTRRAQALRLIDEVLDGELLAAAQEQRQLMQSALAIARARNRTLTIWTSAALLLVGIGGAGVGVFSGYRLAKGLQHHLVELTVSVSSASGSLERVGSVLDPMLLRPTGELSHVRVMVDMLTDRVGAVVERLQLAERESMRQDQMAALGQLAAGLAHELRNPLTAIKTLVEASRAAEANGTLDERDMQVVEEELGRLDNTLQAFLDYARPPQMTRREIDLRSVVQRTTQLISARAEQQDIQFCVCLPPHPVLLQADPAQLQQVLLNIVLNALDSIGSSGTIQIQIDECGAQLVRVLVDDTGKGLPQHLGERVFEPFVSSKSAGTGLGLTISRRIVEAHQGTLSAENLPGAGARFIISLNREPTVEKTH